MLAWHLVRRLSRRSTGEVGSPIGGGLGWVARAVALAALAASAVGGLLGSPAPSLSGAGLGVTLATAVVLASGVALVVATRWRPGLAVADLMLLGLASAALAGLDPNAPGYVGCFIAVGAMALRIDRRVAAAASLVVIAATTAALSLAHLPPHPAAVASIDLGMGFAFVIAIFARDQQRLVVEVREAQEARAQAAVLQERAHLAREMHDVLAHSLTGLSVQLEAARLLLARQGGDGAAADHVERARSLARTGLEEARRAVGALRGDAMPGPELLPRLVTDFAAECGMECRLEVNGEPAPLSAEARLSVYRTAQEALTNIRKHAGTARVAMQLAWSQDGVDLVVDDRSTTAEDGADGVQHGFGAGGGGYGLTGLRERAELLGGNLQAGPVPGGFRVHLHLPA